jgi:vitamin B12 transporter
MSIAAPLLGRQAEPGASQETGPRARNRFHVPRGTKEPFMPLPAFLRRGPSAAARFLCALLIAIAPALVSAASVHGIVTDASGARVAGANVALVHRGRVVASAVTVGDGSFQITTGTRGRFFLLVSAQTFRQLQTPDFYAGRFDSVSRNLVLEPAWVHQSIVVTATGTPTPQPQTSSSTTVLGEKELGPRAQLINPLRQVPGAFVAQVGQYGAQASLFLRGGDSRDTMVLLDGVDATGLGGGFDFGPVSATAIESVEVYRGPDTNLYGGGADSGVVSLTTPHGTTSFPSVLLTADTGNFHTSREQLEVAGARSKLDYLGAFSWFQTANALPNDEYHLATSAANLGWQLTGNTQLRATAHYFVSATGVPNAWNFYHAADDATQKDQNLFLSGLLQNQTSTNFRNTFQYGLARKREQYNRWSPAGQYIPNYDGFGDNAWFGYPVTITGANGDSVNGQALLDYSPNSAYQLVNNRDQYVYEGDLFPTPHLTALLGFRYERERGAQPGGPYPVAFRDDYEYLASVHGDFKTRFFYTLAGGIEHYSLFGTQTSPRGGVSFFVMRPRNGVFSGTRLLVNFGEGVREPSLTDQFYSLYSFLQQNGGQNTLQQLHISPLAMPQTRTWEGGVEQDFLSQHIVFKTTFFHNEFGRQIEYVGLNLIPELLPNLTPAQQNQLETFLQNNGAYELSLNSEAYRAMGIESSVESGIGRNLFLRGGYTYLDAVVQRSFTNSDYTLLGPLPTYNGIPIGVYSPLQGARPFRRPPHTGFFGVTFSSSNITGIFNAAFVSRSDDSDFLGYSAYGSNPNALLLPNRNLDFGYAGLDLGGSYQFRDWLGIEVQADNLLSNQHMAPIGYPSLPMTFRTGLRVDWAARKLPGL